MVRRMDIPEAPLERTEHGLVAAGDGWFVANARELRGLESAGAGRYVTPQGEPRFEQLGIGISVLGPGEPLSMYHWEADQEDFLVLAGEGTLIVEGQERRLRQWDFIHCPPRTEHTIVGGPCVVLGVGARTSDEGEYTVDDAARRHGAGLEPGTPQDQAYARFAPRTPTRYGGWLEES